MSTSVWHRTAGRGKLLGLLVATVAWQICCQPLHSSAGPKPVTAVDPVVYGLGAFVPDPVHSEMPGAAASAACGAHVSASTQESLARSATIAGTISGRNRGLARHHVVAYAQRPIRHGEAGRAVASTSADAQGRYTLSGLPAGEYHVAVISTGGPGRENERPLMSFAPGTPTLTGSQVVAVGAGDHVAGVDVRLPESRRHRVAGTVHSRTGGTLMDGAHVTLSAAFDVGVSAASSMVQTTMIQSDGRFAFAAVPPGEYLLTARSIPRAIVQEIAGSGRSAPLTRAAGSQFGTTRLHIVDRDVDDVAIDVSEGGSISGRVMLGNRSYVPAPGQAGAIVAKPGPEAVAGGALEAMIDKDAAFRVSAIEGQFFLRPAREGMPPLRAVLYRGVNVADSGIAVVTGERIDDVTVLLEATPTHLEVIAPSAVARGCMAVAFSTERSLWTLPWSRYVLTAPFIGTTAQFVGLPPGTYAVALVPQTAGDDVSLTTLEELEADALEVELRSGRPSSVVWSADR